MEIHYRSPTCGTVTKELEMRRQSKESEVKLQFVNRSCILISGSTNVRSAGHKMSKIDEIVPKTMRRRSKVFKLSGSFITVSCFERADFFKPFDTLSQTFDTLNDFNHAEYNFL